MIWITLLMLLYFVPMVVAAIRRTTNRNSVAVVNVFLGWTFIGWVVALAMSASGNQDKVGPKQSNRSAPSQPMFGQQEPHPKHIWFLRPWVLKAFGLQK
jgi:hypothetical protein